MAQELVGNCGAIVGSGDYFHRLNQGAIFSPYMISGEYQYSIAIGQLCSYCVSIIDEIYSDVQSISSAFRELPSENRENLLRLIDNLDEAANFMFPAYTSADGCRSILISDRGKVGYGGTDSIWGDDIGSTGYMQSKCSPIFQSMLSNPLDSIVQTIISDLNGIAGQIAADLDLGVSSHFYMRDENGDAIRGAIQELERCNCSALSFYSTKVSQLCWYRDTPKDKVLELQKALNKISGAGMLTEDGVYGEKTSDAWRSFLDSISHGMFPSLTIINPLQTGVTGIRVKTVSKTKSKTPGLIQNLPGSKLPDSYFQSILLDPYNGKEQTLFHFDAPHGKYNYYHYNYISNRKHLIPLNNHTVITEAAYLKLANFERGAKVVKIAGRVLLVTGIALDLLELGSVMNNDLNDADGKLGRSSISATADIIGQWSGSVAGAKFGAMAGAVIGTAVLPGIGTAVGGFVIGLAGGTLGAYVGEWAAGGLADYILDISEVGE